MIRLGEELYAPLPVYLFLLKRPTDAIANASGGTKINTMTVKLNYEFSCPGTPIGVCPSDSSFASYDHLYGIAKEKRNKYIVKMLSQGSNGVKFSYIEENWSLNVFYI